MNSSIEQIGSAFLDSSKVVLTTHVNPDGDGLGSELALAEWLISRGKTVSVLNHSSTPPVYRFLDSQNRIQQYLPERDSRLLEGADLICVVDTNHPDRLRSMEPLVLSSPATKICIDHHLDPSPFANHYLLDDDATSTGEIIYRLLERLNGKSLSPPIAEALYCAIMTDTGSFRYPRVDPEIFRICAHLIECGADPVKIYSSVYEQWTGGRIRLLGEMLAGLKMEYGGRLAHVTITQEMLTRTMTTEEDTDNFTNYPMSIGGTVVGILFLELQQGLKISFRSKGDIAINELAKEFGGNGHKNAAGARVDGGDLEFVRHMVVKAAARFIR